MRIIYFFLYFLIATNVFAYDCVSKSLDTKNFHSKKSLYSFFHKQERQVLVEATLFELTSIDLAKKENQKKAQMLLNFLTDSEININYQSFFKLLKFSTELDSTSPKALKINEVCEIMDKVNKLK